MPKISIIIPCYFNEYNIPITGKRLIDNEAIFPPSVEFEYVMVDDGSKDGTYQALKTFQSENPGKVVLVKLAANVGSYNAIIAGMEHATGDCNTVISCDLQDPPELIAQMYGYWSRGVKLVIANREDRQDDFPSAIFSRFFNSLTRRLAL